MSQGDRREINRRDLPSVRGEPERVRPMTAACIKRAFWLQTRDFKGEMCVRGTTRDPVRALTQRACPELLPEVSAVGLDGAAVRPAARCHSQ